MGAVWGSLGALTIGLSDLFGRRVTNAQSAVTAALAIQVIAIVTSLVTVPFIDSTWRWVDLGWGAVSGVAFATGLGCYYAGLVRASSTIVAPIVGVLSAVIPFAWTLIRGAELSTLALVGACVAFIGLGVLSSGRIDRATLRAGLTWGLVSGCGYGIGMAVLVEASDESGAWPAVSQRVAAFGALLLAAAVGGHQMSPEPGQRLNGVRAGVFAGLTTVFGLIGLSIDPAPTVVTISMFPVASVLVGYQFYGDAVSRRQVLGIGVALVGVAAVVAS